MAGHLTLDGVIHSYRNSIAIVNLFLRQLDVKNHNRFWIFTGIGKSVILGISNKKVYIDYTFSPLFEEMFQHLFFLA